MAMASHALLRTVCATNSPTTSASPRVAGSSNSHVQLPNSLAPLFSRSLRFRSFLHVGGRIVLHSWRVRCSFSEETYDRNDRNEAFKEAVKGGNLSTVDELLRSQNVSIDLPSASRAGWTALHLASFYGHPAIVQSLLNAGANLEVRNESGNTPLQLACLKGHIDIARILLDSGADIYAQSFDKGTALDYAQEWGGEEITDFLMLYAATSSK